MKKLLALFLMVCTTLSFAFTQSLTSQAEDGVPLSPYVTKLEDVIARKIIDGGVELNKLKVKTVQYGDLQANVWLDQHVQYVTMPAAGSDAIKVVTWSEGTADGWKSSTVRNTAIDFEEKNPGWIVVAAVNGDFFDINATYQPTSTFVQNGDVYKRDRSFETIGFTSDRSHIYGIPTSSSTMSLKVLDGSQVSSTNPISQVNKLPGNSGIALFTTDFNGTVDFTGYTVYQGIYTVNRVTNGGSHFVKGSISSIATDMSTMSKVPQGSFYLVTKEAKYADIIPVGTTLKCEHELTGAFAGVKNVMGTRYQVLKDGVPQYQGKQTSADTSDYTFINTAHPRTLVGFKQDGSVIMMVIDGRHPGEGRNGASLYEAGELLRVAGAVNGYNLDGGGSSTLVVRNENGQFEVINTPSDGSERSIGNAVLFVMQDPKLAATQIAGNQIKFEQTGPIADGVIKNISVRVGGKTYPFEGNSVTVTGLKKNTTYNVTYYYTIEESDGTIRNCTSREYKIKTSEVVYPEIVEFALSSKINLGAKLSYRYTDDENSVEEAYIQYGSEKFVLTNKRGTAEIKGLTDGETYNFKLVLKLTNGQLVESSIVSVTAEPKSSGGGGCSTGAALYFISVISVLSLGLLIIRRRK